MSEWDNIEGLDGWSAKLEELLEEAEQAAQRPDLESRLVLNHRFTEFIVKSTPNTPEIVALDAIAEQTRAGLMRSTIEERLEAISARTAELARLTKKFRAQAEVAQASAASIRLERARRVVDSLTESIRALKDFRGMLEAGTEDDLTKSIERVVSSIQKLRSEVEG